MTFIELANLIFLSQRNDKMVARLDNALQHFDNIDSQMLFLKKLVQEGNTLKTGFSYKDEIIDFNLNFINKYYINTNLDKNLDYILEALYTNYATNFYDAYQLKIGKICNIVGSENFNLDIDYVMVGSGYNPLVTTKENEEKLTLFLPLVIKLETFNRILNETSYKYWGKKQLITSLNYFENKNEEKEMGITKSDLILVEPIKLSFNQSLNVVTEEVIKQEDNYTICN
jgi:hypothetical protein